MLRGCTTRRRRCRGFSLLELLIVIALLATLTALVLPSMMGTRGRHAFESSVDVIGNQLLLARAHAQATGSPVEVVYFHGKTPRVEARFFMPLVEAMADGGGSYSSAGADEDGALPVIDEIDRQLQIEARIGEGWAYRELADGVTIVAQPPDDEQLDTFDTFVEQAERLDDLDSTHRRSVLRIAVFAPDGTAIIGEPVWIVGEDLKGRLQVSSFTGLASFTSVADLSPDDELFAEDDPLDDSDLFDDSANEPDP